MVPAVLEESEVRDGPAVLAELVVLEVLDGPAVRVEPVVLAEWVVLAESVGSVALGAPVVQEEPVVLAEWVALEGPAESAGATGQRNGNTTHSIAAERLMEIDPRPTDSAARLEAMSGIVKPERVRISAREAARDSPAMQGHPEGAAWEAPTACPAEPEAAIASEIGRLPDRAPDPVEPSADPAPVAEHGSAEREAPPALAAHGAVAAVDPAAEDDADDDGEIETGRKDREIHQANDRSGRNCDLDGVSRRDAVRADHV